MQSALRRTVRGRGSSDGGVVVGGVVVSPGEKLPCGQNQISGILIKQPSFHSGLFTLLLVPSSSSRAAACLFPFVADFVVSPDRWRCSSRSREGRHRTLPVPPVFQPSRREPVAKLLFPFISWARTRAPGAIPSARHGEDRNRKRKRATDEETMVESGVCRSVFPGERRRS